MTVQSSFTKTNLLIDAQSGVTQVAKLVSVPNNTTTALFTVKQGGGTRNMVCLVRLDVVLNAAIGASSEDLAARTASYLLSFSDYATIVQQEYLSAAMNGNIDNRSIGAPTVTVAEITSDSFEIRIQAVSSGALSPFPFNAYCFATVLSNNATIE